MSPKNSEPVRVIRTCDECGGRFSATGSQSLCDLCTQRQWEYNARVCEAIEDKGLTTPREIAEHTGLQYDTVVRTIRESSTLSGMVQSYRQCARCADQMADPGSKYCPDCRMLLNEHLGQAVARMRDEKRAEKAPPPPAQEKAPRSPATHAGTFHSRRRRGGAHVNPVPKGRYSG
jgi:hypothetical protein